MLHGFDYSAFMTCSDSERMKLISGAVNFIIGIDKKDKLEAFEKEALMLHQSLSLCSSIVNESVSSLIKSP